MVNTKHILKSANLYDPIARVCSWKSKSVRALMARRLLLGVTELSCPKVANTHPGPPSWKTTDMPGVVCRESGGDFRRNGRCSESQGAPQGEINAIHIFSAKRIPSSPSWLRRCSVCSTGDSVRMPLKLHFPHQNLGHTHFQINPIQILLIRYIPFIYIYICICQCIWICRCRCIHIYIYICRCTCICICIFLSYEGWLPINHYTQVAWNRPTGAGDQRLQDHGAGAQGLASGKLSGKVGPSDHFIN